MRKNFGVKPYIYPQPVFILAAYDENGNPNAMNAAWGGIGDDDELTLCISAGHKTAKNITAARAFTVSSADVAHAAQCDFVGIVSGNTATDKWERSGFHATRSAFVNAPLIDELPIAAECELKSYDPETGRLVGKIRNISVDERVLDENGNVDVQKACPITFDPFNNTYVALGNTIAKAFHVGKTLK